MTSVEVTKTSYELELTLKISPAQRGGLSKAPISEHFEYFLSGHSDGLERLNSAIVKTLGGEHPQRVPLKFNGKDGAIFLFLGVGNLILTEIHIGLLLSGDLGELTNLSTATMDCIKNLSSPKKIDGYHHHIELFDLTLPFKSGDPRRVGKLTIGCAG